MNNRVIKLFFDVNLSSVLVSELMTFYKQDYPNLQTKHLTEFTRANAPDLDWIGMLARETPKWVVISADRGKNSAPSQKLPLICRQYKISCILLTGGLLRRGKLHHKQAIVSVWPDIVAFCGMPSGSEAKLGGHSGANLAKASLRIYHVPNENVNKSDLFE